MTIHKILLHPEMQKCKDYSPWSETQISTKKSYKLIETCYKTRTCTISLSTSYSINLGCKLIKSSCTKNSPWSKTQSQQILKIHINQLKHATQLEVVHMYHCDQYIMLYKPGMQTQNPTAPRDAKMQRLQVSDLISTNF